MIDIRINESTFPLSNGSFGKLAIFIYTGNGDPKDHLEKAVKLYVGNSEIPYHIFIDAHMNCPWMLTLISNINDIEDITEKWHRDEKINNILNIKNNLKEIGI
jgi:hypothetical protein